MLNSPRAIVIGTTAAAAVLGVRIATDQAVPATAMAAAAPVRVEAVAVATTPTVEAEHPSTVAPARADAGVPRLEMAGYLAPDGMSSLLSSRAGDGGEQGPWRADDQGDVVQGAAAPTARAVAPPR